MIFLIVYYEDFISLKDDKYTTNVSVSNDCNLPMVNYWYNYTKFLTIHNANKETILNMTYKIKEQVDKINKQHKQ